MLGFVSTVSSPFGWLMCIEIFIIIVTCQDRHSSCICKENLQKKKKVCMCMCVVFGVCVCTHAFICPVADTARVGEGSR